MHYYGDSGDHLASPRSANAGDVGRVEDDVRDWLHHPALRAESGSGVRYFPSHLPCRASCTTIDDKSGTQSHIERLGYHIVANIGVQASDLAGGHAERMFKLPNPMYLTPQERPAGSSGCPLGITSRMHL